MMETGLTFDDEIKRADQYIIRPDNTVFDFETELIYPPNFKNFSEFLSF